MGGYNIIPEIEVIEYKNEWFYLYEEYHELRKILMNDKARIDAQKRVVYANLGDNNLLLYSLVDECDSGADVFRDIPDVLVIKLHWQMDMAEYKKNRDLLTEARRKKERYLIVWTSQKIWRWVDIPEIDTIFLFFPCKFEWTVVQAVWRALRHSPWKTNVKLYDWNDEILKWQGKKRQSAYRKEYLNCKITKTKWTDEKS